MFIKMLILGRPGSGKTTAFHRMKTLMENRGVITSRIRDYEILQSMAKHETEGKKFCATDYGGFDIVDFSVLDTALLEVERQVKLRMLTVQKDELVVVEFARSDYRTGLEPFSPEFLQNTHILFIDADVETCIWRIHQRVADGLAPDKHFVSDHILRGYYGHDNRSYMKHLAELSAESRRRGQSTRGVVWCIENTGLLDDFYTAIDDFIATVIKQEQSTFAIKKLPYLRVSINGSEFIKQ